MSVVDEKLIDLAGLELEKRCLVLSICDHLTWGEETDDVHLFMLQNKINDYLRFVESGEVNEQFKHDDYEKVIIRVIAKHAFSSECIEFFTRALPMISDAGLTLEWEVSSARAQPEATL